MNSKLIITLGNLPKVGRKTVQNILNLAGPDRVSSFKELAQFLNSEENKIQNFKSPAISVLENAHDKASYIIEKSKEAGIKETGFFDPLFPDCLKNIKDYPVIL